MFFTHIVLFVFTAWFFWVRTEYGAYNPGTFWLRGAGFIVLDRSFFGIRSGIGLVDSLVWDEYTGAKEEIKSFNVMLPFSSTPRRTIVLNCLRTS